MPVTAFNRLTDPAPTMGMTDQGVWEVRETWQAIFDSQVNDPLAFLGDPMLPGLGAEHPYNSNLRLYSVPSGQFAKGALTAINFNLVWSTGRMPPRFERDKYDPEPGLRNITWGHRIITEPVEKAYVSDDDGETFSEDKTPIETILGEKMIPGLEKNRYLPVCRYSENLLMVPFETLNFPGYVNDDEFTLDGLPVAPGQALIVAAPISAEKRFEEFIFRTVDYEIVLKEDGWDDAVLHRGFRCRAEYATDLDPVGPEFPEGVDFIWRGEKRCMVPNGDADTAVKRPFVQSPEACILNIDGINLTQWTQPVDLENVKLELNDENLTERWYLNGGLGKTKETFVPHYRVFRHAERTSFAAWGFY